MCDYSLEHLESVEAAPGKVYQIDACVVHGFATGERGRNNMPIVACVLPGQRLQLDDIMPTWGQLIPVLPTSAVVTVVTKRSDPERYHHFGLFNDGILFANGFSMPLTGLLHATMRVLPATEKPRDLDKLLELDRLPAAEPYDEARVPADAD